MNPIPILVVCAHPEILKTMLRLINSNPDWKAVGATNYEEAWNSQTYRVVLLGSGLPDKESETIRDFFSKRSPRVPVIQHYGGGSGLLFGEIYQALA